MMAEGIDYASNPPTVFISDGIDFFCSGLDRPSKNGVGVGDGHDDADGYSAKGLRAKVVVFRRFVAEPEFCALDRKAGHDAVTGVKSK